MTIYRVLLPIIPLWTSNLNWTFTGKDFWTGGLNPGLLWIWSNSARPVASNSTENPSNNNNIKGNGRCLKLAYNPVLRGYEYQGSECSVRASYICEYEENSTSRALERIQKSLEEKSPSGVKTSKFWACWNTVLIMQFNLYLHIFWSCYHASHFV